MLSKRHVLNKVLYPLMHFTSISKSVHKNTFIFFFLVNLDTLVEHLCGS
jgi:hypothetical protein